MTVLFLTTTSRTGKSWRVASQGRLNCTRIGNAWQASTGESA